MATVKESDEFFKSHQYSKEEKDDETEEDGEEETFLKCRVECKLKQYSYAVKRQGTFRISTFKIILNYLIHFAE